MKHDELVKALRCCGNISTDCTVCPWDKYNYGMCAESLYTTAAAAIESLQAEAEKPITLEQAIDRLHELGWLQEHDRILTEPKRGEWTWMQRANGGHYKGCSVCHAPMPTDSMLDYLDDEDCEFCYSCGAKMGVQDD